MAYDTLKKKTNTNTSTYFFLQKHQWYVFCERYCGVPGEWDAEIWGWNSERV